MTAIYIASRFTHRERNRRIRDTLQALGYPVTSRWLTDGPDSDPASPERCALVDCEDIARANVLVFFAEGPGEGGRNNGRLVELGMALALDRRVLMIGHRETVFANLPQIEFYATWNEALAILATEADPDFADSAATWEETLQRKILRRKCITQWGEDLRPNAIADQLKREIENDDAPQF